MNKLVKLKVILVLLILSLIAFSTFIGANFTTTYAATDKMKDYSDEFSGSEFSQEWYSDAAQLVSDYNALALIDFDLWGPCINLANHVVKNNSVITFEVNFKSGQWLGLAFGLASNTTRFYYGQTALIMSSDAVNGTQLMSRTSGQLTSSTMSDKPTFDTLFSNKRVKIKLEIDTNNNISIYKSVNGKKFDLVGVFEDSFVEGYIGFSGMGKTNVDILSFEYQNNGQTVYTDDFTTSKLGYQSTGVVGKDWYVTFKYDANNAKLGAFNHVELSAGDSLVFNKQIIDNKISENIFQASFLLNVEDLSEGSFAGVCVGMSDKENLSSGSFIGFGKESDFYYLAHVKNGVILDVKASYNQNDFLASGQFVQFKCNSLFGNRFIVEVFGESYLFDNVIPDGYFGIGVLSENLENCRLSIDDFSLDSYTYNVSSAEDLAINFQGYNEEILYGYSVKNYYINKSKFYSSGYVKQPMTYNEGEGYLEFACVTDNSAFIPKANYSEAIVRFDVRMNATAQNTAEYARFGVGYGLPSEYFSPTYSTYIFFQNQKNYSGAATPTIFGCSGANIEYVCPDYNNFSAKYISCDYDMWKDTETIYNFMLISENNTIKVYFKENSEPESEMQILRAQFKDANIYGHIAIFGNTSAKFDLLNLSITNINPYKQEDISGFLKSGTEVKDTVKLNAGEKVVAKTIYDNSLTFAKVNVSDGIKISFGERSLVLSKTGVLADEKTTIIKDNFTQNLLDGTAYLRIEILGEKLYVSIRNGGSEAQLYNNVIEASLSDKPANSAITFEAVGDKLSLFSGYSVSLDSKVEIATEIYDAELENLNNKIVVKPEKQQGASDATLYIVIGSVCTVAIAATVVCILLVRRKRRAK